MVPLLLQFVTKNLLHNVFCFVQNRPEAGVNFLKKQKKTQNAACTYICIRVYSRNIILIPEDVYPFM